MEQTIQIKRNNSDANKKPESLLIGELAINLLDRSLFSSDGVNVIQLYTGDNKWFDLLGNAHNALKLGGFLPTYFQQALESGVNIKTINNQSILGKGNINIEGNLSSISIKIGNTAYDSVDGVVSLPSYPVVPTLLSEFTDDVVAGHYVPIKGIMGANSVKGSAFAYTYATDAHGGKYAGGLISAGISSDGFQINANTFGTKIAIRGLDSGVFGEWKELALLDDVYTKTQSDGKYLPLSGGTVGSSSWAKQLTLHRPNINGAVVLGFSNGPDGQLGYLGIGGSGSGNIAKVPFYEDANGNDYLLIHSGNIGEQSVTSATKLETARTIWGQSFDGTGNVSGDIVSNGSLYLGYNKAALYAPLTDGGDNKIFLQVNPSGNVLLGQQVAQSGLDTFIYGNNIRLCYGTVGSISQTALMVNSSGNVLIGTTTDDGNKLRVNGIIKTTKGISSQSLNIDKDNEAGEINRESANLHLQYRSSKGVTMCVGGGNVRIGKIADDGYKLDVNGTVKSEGFVSTSIDIEKDGQTGEINRTTGKLYLQFSTSNHLILCQGGGKVGIGAYDPVYKLDVSGTGRFTESLTIGGATLSWDETNNCLRVNTNLATDGELTAGGVSDAAVVTEYDSAAEIAELNRRITELENRLAAYEQ